jgi:hypothetical protein
MRLPEEEAERARERLRREYGSKVSSGMLEAADWVIEFVTAPRERIPLGMVFGLYPLRWQVELQIKRDKSVGGMDKLPNFRDDTIATWLNAKLLLQQIVRKIISPAVVLPPEPPTSPVPPPAPSPPAAYDAIGVAGVAVFGGERDPPAPQARDRRRDVARHGPRLPVAPRRPEPRRAA